MILARANEEKKGGRIMAQSDDADAVAPDFVLKLEAVFGVPSQAAFGSAVFHEHLATGDKLEQGALAKYKYFVGELWARYGEDAWMGPWQEVYARAKDATADIAGELGTLADRAAKLSASMLLEAGEDAAASLAAAFDDATVTELAVYALGDGGAMSGVLVAGRRAAREEATYLVFLLD